MLGKRTTALALAAIASCLPPSNGTEPPAAGSDAGRQSQYHAGEINIPGAWAKEPARAAFSLPAALGYLEEGAAAWTDDRGCISCHTNGSYLLTRPALTAVAGRPSEAIRQFFVEELRGFEKEAPGKLKSGVKPTQIAYLAAGLAEWDKHVAGSLSPETAAALRLLFSVQAKDGSFGNLDCWPPLESSAFHGATVAAMAAASAPGWLASVGDGDGETAAGFQKLTAYLATADPGNDYGRLLLLWAAARLPDLIPAERKAAIIAAVWKHQRADGGWSLRSFAAPEAWGRGNRAAKLRSEPEFADPPSDGHMTGLAVLVLRESGVPAADPRIRKAVAWIESNQRESGRWWTRSLNTDKFHFITYSGTAYPLLALAHCDALR